MKTPLTIACWLIAIILFFTIACQREISDPGGHPSGNTEQVIANLTGRITDPDNKPVDGATVKAGTATTTTDINGVFRINNVRLAKNAGFVKVEKTGFFQGSRTFMVHEGTTNYIAIQLIKKTVSGTVSGTGSGTIAVANGGSIAFTPGSFINTTNNTSYVGTVSVSAFFIDPAAGNFKEIMPGTLRGINSSNEETGLQSFGMMAVELNGAAGEKLQLASGKPAQITFPIPTGLLAQAPATIPLWSFNDTTGLWRQEGTATRQGSNYIGTVSHFSFWNCDYPYGVVDFKAVVKDQAGNALFPTQVTLTVVGDKLSSVGSGYTDSTGMVSGKIPYGKSLELNVISRCNTVIYTQTIGPFTSNADMGTITINNVALTQVTISGTAVKCNGNAVTNGFAEIALDGALNRALINNGNFSLTITRCTNASATAAITAYDTDAAQYGTAVNVSVTSGNVPAGQVSACGTATTQFLNYTLNSAQTSFAAPADSLTLTKNGLNSFALWAMRIGSGNDYVNMTFNATGVGNTPVTGINLRNGNKTYMKQAAFNVNITEFGGVGGYVSGSFSATLADSTGTAPVNLSFRVKRSN